MSKFPLIFLLIVVLIVVLATRQYFVKRRQDAANNASPARTLQVKVTSKREFPTSNRRSRQREVIPVEDMRYEVYFQPLAGGSEIKLQLAKDDYHRIDKGVKGALRLQGTRFISFVPMA
jgi:hypothetical protein